MNYSFRSFQSQSDLSSRKLAKSCNIQDPSIYFQFSPRKYYFNRVHFTKITRHKIGIFQSITCPVQDYSSTRASETIEMEDSFFDQRQVRTLTIDRWWSHERRQDDFIPHNWPFPRDYYFFIKPLRKPRVGGSGLVEGPDGRKGNQHPEKLHLQGRPFPPSLPPFAKYIRAGKLKTSDRPAWIKYRLNLS